MLISSESAPKNGGAAGSSWTKAEAVEAAHASRAGAAYAARPSLYKSPAEKQDLQGRNRLKRGLEVRCSELLV